MPVNHNPINDFTEVRPSPIHGLGIFAIQDIPAGTTWWRAVRKRDVLLINEARYMALRDSQHGEISRALFNAITTYSYFLEEENALILILDNARYTNHSEHPNSEPIHEAGVIGSITLRDIRAGEELIENYDLFDQCQWEGFTEDYWMPDK